MIKKFLLLILITIIANPVFADAFNHPKELSYISTQIPKLNSINCRFKQEKYLPNSNVTLHSGGNFNFTKNVGVTFYTTYPIKSTTSYTNKEYKQINSVINAISNKSYSRLEKDFKFYYVKNSSSWDLGLIPQSKSKSAQYLKSIEIWGDKDISQIVITTKDATRTTIHFIK